MQCPKISVIVPVYKVENYIYRCVDSILAQTYRNFELILVDDGSPDNCGEICENYAKKDSRIVVLHRKNGGLSAARNTGMDWVYQNSGSQFITFIDSDDWVHPQYLEILLDAAQKNSVPVSVCAFFRAEKYEPEKLAHYETQPKVKTVSAEDFLTDYVWHFNYACGKLYRRDFFEEIRYPEGKLFEDTFTTYKVIFAGKQVAFADCELYFYFYNTEGISHSLWTPSELVIMDGMREQMEFYRKNGYTKAYEKEKYLYVNHFAYQICRIRENKKDLKQNMPYLRNLRREMMRIVHQDSDKYGYRQMPQCYEAAYPNIMKLYHAAGALARKIKKQMTKGFVKQK